MGIGPDTIVASPVVAPVAAAVAATVIGAATRTSITRPTLPDLPSPALASAANRAVTSRRSRSAVVVLVLAVAAVAGPMVLAATAVGALLVHQLRPILTARRRRAEIERTLPDAMDLLVLSVRAGLTPVQAVRELAVSVAPPVGEAFAEVVRRTERSQPFADALVALPERLGPQASGLADVIATSDRHGLPLGPVLDQLAAEVRSTRRRLDQADARKLPVRLSFPLVVCTLPSFVLLAIAPAVIAALSSLGGSAW
jgi:tight adherence protein C